jgi:hypothetical protein
MMCHTCKKAGQLLAAGVTEIADAYHKACEYKDCTCQHKLTTVLKDSQTTGRPSS